MQTPKIVLYLYLYIYKYKYRGWNGIFVQRENQLSHCHTVTHASHRNPVKCSKSRLVTTSAIKHFTPKVAYFYPKSGVVLGASIYVKPLPNRHSRASSPTRSLSKGKGVQKRINISRTSYLAPSIITNQKNYQSWKKIHGRRLYRWWYLYWRQHWLHWERHRVWVTDRYTSKKVKASTEWSGL